MKLSKKILESKFRVSNISLSPKSPRRTPLQQLRRSALSSRSEGASTSKRVRVDESVRRIDQIAGYFPLEIIDSHEKSVSPSFANDIFNEDLDSSFSTDISTNENNTPDRDRTRFKCCCGCNKTYQIHKMRQCWSCDNAEIRSKCGQYCLPCGEKMNSTSSEDEKEI